jgi:hypothetical protein
MLLLETIARPERAERATGARMRAEVAPRDAA